MAVPPIDGGVGNLWHLNLKINAGYHGYQEKWGINAVDDVAARTAGEAIAAAYKRIMPAANCEIFYATVSNYTHARDSKFLRAATGPGLFLTSSGPDVAAKVETSWQGVKLRLENAAGTSVSKCINPIPDAVVEDEALVPTFTDIVATYAGADTAPVDLTDFPAQFLHLCKMLTKYSVHVFSGAIPGGAWKYSPYTGAFAMDVTKKKGSRAFI